MDAQKLKNNIIKRIDEIDDVNTLKSIDILLNSSDKNIEKFLNFTMDKTKNGNISETEDFTDYIKEWVKSM